MTKSRILPYRVADEAAVNWHSWWYEHADTRLPLPKYLPAWDYASTLVVGLTAEFDVRTLLDSTGVDSMEQMCLVLVADCKTAQRRFTASVSLTHTSAVADISLTIPPGQIADKLDVSATLVLAAPLDGQSNRARRPGSRLAESPRLTVILEGEASRFPTESISFSAAGYEGAPWTLSSNAESLTDSFMASVRLLINEDHPWGQRLIDDATDELSKHLQVYVLRTLVLHASELDAEDVAEFEDDSLGGVIDYMCNLYLRRGVRESAKMAREEPRRFDRLAYAAVTP